MDDLQAPRLGAPPAPEAEPIEPVHDDTELPAPHDPPRGDEPTELEPGGLEEAAQAHAAGPAAPDLSNLGNVLHDRPHFIRLLDGQDPSEAVCGQDGEPWPCQAMQKLTTASLANQRGDMIELPIQQAGNLNISGDAGSMITLEQAAQAAGVTVEEMRQRVANWRAR